MSALIRSERWRTRFVLCLAVVVLGVLAVGAKDVTIELRHRQARDRFGVAARTWSDTLLLERPVEERKEWEAVLADRPELLLQACAVTRPVDPAVTGRGNVQ